MANSKVPSKLSARCYSQLPRDDETGDKSVHETIRASIVHFSLLRELLCQLASISQLELSHVTLLSDFF